MLMTCPHCRAAAKLAPNRWSDESEKGFISRPRYRLTCSGCAETTVGQLADTEDSIHQNILSAAKQNSRFAHRVRDKV
jgi:hypothetical protein